MIGVFDSGVGGLFILREVRRLLPTVDLVYLADQANVPYGERSLDEVRSLSQAGVGILVDAGASSVVIACNTASAAALDHLRGVFPTIGFVGMEPAVKPAAGATESGVVAVLATEATFRAARFDQLVGRFADGVEVIAHPCPGWAVAVEERWPDAASESIERHLAPLLARGVDTIVLACTHYSFLSPTIAAVIGAGVTIVDPAAAVARQTARVAEATGDGTTRYLTSGDPVRLAAQIERLLGESVAAESAG
jgi:glutamate racemase